MKNKIALLFISSLILTCAVHADDYTSMDGFDYTGEAYFMTSSPMEKNAPAERASSKRNETIPPLKLLRLKLQNRAMLKDQTDLELAPTGQESYQGEIETSEYASQDLTEKFDDMSPDGFEADEDSVNEKPKKSLFGKKTANNENNEEIILDCDKVDYDTANYLVYARGNVNVTFVKQGTVVKADLITFDRANNTIKAEGDVKICKNNRVITGDYIFVDLNEENALIENPLTSTATIEMRAKKGYVYGDKITQENGSIDVKGSYPINFRSNTNGPRVYDMLIPPKQDLSEDMEKGLIKFDAKTIKVTQKGDLETIAIKKGRLQKGSRTIFKVPAVKIYTNKNHDYVESNIWEIGAYRGLGTYTGPGWVFELPKGSVLKAMPILNYKSGFGFGALGRFNSGTNSTMVAYGSQAKRIIGYGRQKLDDNLFLQYGANAYMDEWFMGRRRPKYGVALVYDKRYSAPDFLLPGKTSMFEHRLEAGYFHDLDFDQKYEKIAGGRNMGTTRFRYMASAFQPFIDLRDEDKLQAFSFGVSSQLSAAIYGTGDTQVVGRIGPYAHMQYKRWMQDVGYMFSAYDDNTPLPVFDAYRFGKQSLYLREYFRICRWLTVSWLGVFNMSNDSPNHKDIQGNTFYVSVGPDDFKFSVGYDFIRQNLRCTVEMMMDTKGAHVDYEKLEIKQEKKAEKKNEPVVAKKTPANMAPVAPQVLQKAIVEDVKVMEEVL